MKTFGRILGIFFVVVALVILAADLLAATKSTGSRIMPLGQLWYTLDAGSLNLVQAVSCNGRPRQCSGCWGS